mgnify:CR=1 FL=1
MSSNNKSGNSSSNSKSVRDTLNRFKMETSNELGIDLTNTDTLRTVDAGRVGGNMVRKMIDIAKNS